MRIGIFTDSYRPQVNGVVYVTEILRRNLEDLGHEVFIFAAAAGFNTKTETDPQIIRFPAIQRFPYKDFNVALFFPPAVVKKIDQKQLDVIHCLTPGPIGLMGMYASEQLKIPVISEYCTDLFEYVQRYSLSFPSIIAMGLVLPFAFKASREEMREILSGWRPKRSIGAWNQEMVKNNLNVLHEHCDAVIVHSRKSAEQLASWQNETKYPIINIPTGVDPIPGATKSDIEAFCKQWQIDPKDEVLLYIGRIAAEKNLDLLVNMMGELIKWRPNAKMLFVGDFDYRAELEAKAAASPAKDRILFVGRIEREKLGVPLGLAKLFVFPSMTDTQSLTLHEAALASLPIVMIDEAVTEVVHEGTSGLFAKNDPLDFADKVRTILENPELRVSLGKAAQKLAGRFTEAGQTKKVAELYEEIIEKRKVAKANIS